MKKIQQLLIPFLCMLFFSGCATKQEVLTAKTNYSKRIQTVAIVADNGNSTEMTTHLESALIKQGLTLKTNLPQGTQKSADVDALVSYIDVWRWDIVMYLQKLNIKIVDAESGDLLATGHWSDSALHGFRDARLVTEQLTSSVVKAISKN